jgi:hypothetical protein
MPGWQMVKDHSQIADYPLGEAINLVITGKYKCSKKSSGYLFNENTQRTNI